MAGRYEMLWDCPSCGTKKLLGLSHRHCPACGAAQDPTRRYFPDEADKVAVEDHPYHGVDRTCAACDSPNAAKAAFCVNCGAPMDGGKPVALKTDAPPPKPKAAPRRWPWLVGLAAVAAMLFACAGVAVFVFWTRDATLTVTGHAWERAIDVEALREVRETAWHDGVPVGARSVSCHREQRSTTQVADGGETCSKTRTDNGDGTYSEHETCTPTTRTEPVYDDRCDYTVDRWIVVSTARAGGSLAQPTAWPVATPGPGERAGARHETYTVTFREADGTTRTCDLAEARWRAIADGSRWSAPVGVLSGSLDCDALVAR